MNVDGERIKLDTIDSLLEQRLFRRTVTKQINKKPPRITTKEFEKYTDMLLSHIEIIKAPIGSSLIEQLKDHLEEYCTNDSSATTTKEQIFLGNVWTNEGKHYFIFKIYILIFLVSLMPIFCLSNIKRSAFVFMCCKLLFFFTKHINTMFIIPFH